MRTRRSWRNQDILFKALTPPVEPASPAPKVDRCWDCARYPKGGRERGVCSFKGLVAGRMAGMGCFKARASRARRTE